MIPFPFGEGSIAEWYILNGSFGPENANIKMGSIHYCIGASINNGWKNEFAEMISEIASYTIKNSKIHGEKVINKKL